MKKSVMLSIRGMQRYPEQDPEVIASSGNAMTEIFPSGHAVRIRERIFSTFPFGSAT